MRGQRIEHDYAVKVAMHILLYACFSYATSGIPIATCSIRPAIGQLAAISAIYGPLFGFLVGVCGNMLVDLLHGEWWPYWSIANGIIGLISGLLRYVDHFYPERGEITRVHYGVFLFLGCAGNYVGMTLAGIADVLFMGAPFQLAVMKGAVTTATVNVLFLAVLGTAVLHAYALLKRQQRLKGRLL